MSLFDLAAAVEALFFLESALAWKVSCAPVEVVTAAGSPFPKGLVPTEEGVVRAPGECGAREFSALVGCRAWVAPARKMEAVGSTKIYVAAD